MVNTEIRLIIFFAAKDGEALYSQQKLTIQAATADCGSDHEPQVHLRSIQVAADECSEILHYLKCGMQCFRRTIYEPDQNR